MATYWAEIGDTPYGKAGLYREKVELGAFPVGMHEQLRLELLNSNNTFDHPFWGGDNLKLRQIISAQSESFKQQVSIGIIQGV